MEKKLYCLRIKCCELSVVQWMTMNYSSDANVRKKRRDLKMKRETKISNYIKIKRIQ